MCHAGDAMKNFYFIKLQQLKNPSDVIKAA